MANLGAIGIDAGAELVGWNDYHVQIGYLLTKTVSGIITDENGDPVARTVRLYTRAAGFRVSEATSDSGTGAYALMAPDEEVQRVAMDDDAGDLLNDLIDRVLPG